jgi:hypothetical protein
MLRCGRLSVWTLFGGLRRQPNYVPSLMFLKKLSSSPILSSTRSYPLQAPSLSAPHLWTTLPSQGPATGTLSLPRSLRSMKRLLWRLSHVTDPFPRCSFPRGTWRPNPSSCYFARPRCAPSTFVHCGRGGPCLRLGRPMPAPTPIHLTLSTERGGLRHCSPPPDRSWPRGRTLYFQVFQTFHTYIYYVSSVLSKYCRSQSAILHMLQRQYTHVVSLCFKCFSHLFQTFHLDVSKVDLGIAHVAMTT